MSKSTSKASILTEAVVLSIFALFFFTVGIITLSENSPLISWGFIVVSGAGIIAICLRAAKQLDDLSRDIANGHAEVPVASVTPATDTYISSNTSKYPSENDDVDLVSSKKSSKNEVGGCCGCLLLLALLGLFIPWFAPFTEALVAAWSVFWGAF